MPKISVIVPAFNEEKYIKNTLDGISKQDFKDFEIIVADGGSTDRTRAIARKYGRVVLEKHRGIGTGRNAGAKVARGEILVFLDADTKPAKNLLGVWSKAFDDDIVAATGPILPLEKTGVLIDVGYRLVSMGLVRLSVILGQPSIIGSNFAVRKTAFEKVGGFDEKLMTYEDLDLSGRLKKQGRIMYVKKALVYTSARRVEKWGVVGYFAYHFINIFRYNLFKRPSTNYVEVR